MRKWGQLHPALRAVVVGVVAYAVILAIGLTVGASPEDAVANAVFYALMIGGGLFFLTKRFPTSTATPEDQDKSVMFLRFPHSPPGSLSSSWQRGIASPGPGRIDFQPALYEQLIPSGRSKALTGLRVTDSPPRKSNHHDHQQDVPLGFLVVTLDSDGAVIEIAASPANLEKIQHDVGSTSS